MRSVTDFLRRCQVHRRSIAYLACNKHIICIRSRNFTFDSNLFSFYQYFSALRLAQCSTCDPFPLLFVHVFVLPFSVFISSAVRILFFRFVSLNLGCGRMFNWLFASFLHNRIRSNIHISAFFLQMPGYIECMFMILITGIHHFHNVSLSCNRSPSIQSSVHTRFRSLAFNLLQRVSVLLLLPT